MPLGDPDYRVYQAPQWLSKPLTVDVPAAVAGILMTLPKPGSPMSDTDKACFMAALGGVLDLCYPPERSTDE